MQLILYGIDFVYSILANVFIHSNILSVDSFTFYRQETKFQRGYATCPK